MSTAPYSGFSTNVSAAVGDAAQAGKGLVQDNFLIGMLITGAFVVWRVGKRVIKSIA
jgi:hypothetical protein